MDGLVSLLFEQFVRPKFTALSNSELPKVEITTTRNQDQLLGQVTIKFGLEESEVEDFGTLSREITEFNMPKQLFKGDKNKFPTIIKEHGIKSMIGGRESYSIELGKLRTLLLEPGEFDNHHTMINLVAGPEPGRILTIYGQLSPTTRLIYTPESEKYSIKDTMTDQVVSGRVEIFTLRKGEPCYQTLEGVA